MQSSGGLEIHEGHLDLIVAYCTCVKYTMATNKYNSYNFNFTFDFRMKPGELGLPFRQLMSSQGAEKVALRVHNLRISLWRRATLEAEGKQKRDAPPCTCNLPGHYSSPPLHVHRTLKLWHQRRSLRTTYQQR